MKINSSLPDVSLLYQLQALTITQLVNHLQITRSQEAPSSFSPLNVTLEFTNVELISIFGLNLNSMQNYLF